MLRLEGEIKGRKNELRLSMILRSLHSAALNGRTWGWSAMEFALTLHGQPDGGP